MAQHTVTNFARLAWVAVVLVLTTHRIGRSGEAHDRPDAFTIAIRRVQRPVPCSSWRVSSADDTAAATALTQLAVKMKAFADSAVGILSDRTPNWEDATPEFFSSAAEIARRGAAFAPDYLPSLIVASQVSLRAATLGEARMDTVWGKAAECYAKRALELAERQGRKSTAAEASELLKDVELGLKDERRAAEAERRHRP